MQAVLHLFWINKDIFTIKANHQGAHTVAVTVLITVTWILLLYYSSWSIFISLLTHNNDYFTTISLTLTWCLLVWTAFHSIYWRKNQTRLLFKMTWRNRKTHFVKETYENREMVIHSQFIVDRNRFNTVAVQ